MTIIQFIDNNPVRNIAGYKLHEEDTVIFCGEKEVMDRVLPDYRRFLKHRGAKVNIRTIYLNTYNFEEVRDKLESIILDNPGCTLDVSGGNDMLLFTVGTLYEKYINEGVQVQVVDFFDGKIVDVDGDGQTQQSNMPFLSIEENIILHGGYIKESNENAITRASLNDSVLNDINNLWTVCRKDCTLWNSLAATLGECRIQIDTCDKNVLYVDTSLFKKLKGRKHQSKSQFDLFNSLKSRGLLTWEKNNDDTYKIVFKNNVIKECVDKGGTPLELKTYIDALAFAKDDEYYFDDVRTGVTIEWSEKSPFRVGDDTLNEIDIIVSRAYDIYFVSCKSGNITEEELYKLDTVAIKFGGISAKKILLVTDYGRLGNTPKALYKFKERARNMNIKIIDNIHKKSSDNFSSIFMDNNCF